MKRQFVGKRDATGGQGSVLRGAAVEFSVFECEDVNGAFVTGGTEERGVMAEVDAGKIKEKEKKKRKACESLKQTSGHKYLFIEEWRHSTRTSSCSICFFFLLTPLKTVVVLQCIVFIVHQ